SIALASMAFNPNVASAQHPGFKIAIAQPPAAATQATQATMGTLVATPTIAIPFQLPVQLQNLQNPTVIIPTHILVPGQTFIQGPSVAVSAPVVFFAPVVPP